MTPYLPFRSLNGAGLSEISITLTKTMLALEFPLARCFIELFRSFAVRQHLQFYVILLVISK